MRKLYLSFYSLLFIYSSVFGANYVTHKIKTSSSHTDNLDGDWCSVTFSPSDYSMSDQDLASWWGLPDAIIPTNAYFVNGNRHKTDTIENCSYNSSSDKSSFYEIVTQNVEANVICEDGFYFHESPISCDNIAPCPNDDSIVPGLNQSQCVDSFTDYSTDGIAIRYDELYYQTCDSTCRGIPTPLSCEDLVPYWKKSYNCNNDEYFIYDCADTNSTGAINPSKTGCQAKMNPCQDLKDSIGNQCADNMHVLGKCSDNGLKITSTSLHCGTDDLQKEQDCRLVNYSSWNATTKTCDCNSGYSKTNFGSCWKNLDANATSEEISFDSENKKTAEKESVIQLEAKEAQESQTESLNNTEDTLAAVRRDNEQNHNDNTEIIGLLNDIKNNTLDFNVTNIDSQASSYYSSLDDVFVTVQDSFTTIGNDFSSMKSSVDNGFTSNISSGTNPDFSFLFHGKTISIDLCTSFSKFRSIIYFMSVIFFTVLGIRFFLIGFKIGL